MSSAETTLVVMESMRQLIRGLDLEAPDLYERLTELLATHGYAVPPRSYVQIVLEHARLFRVCSRAVFATQIVLWPRTRQP